MIYYTAVFTVKQFTKCKCLILRSVGDIVTWATLHFVCAGFLITVCSFEKSESMVIDRLNRKDKSAYKRESSVFLSDRGIKSFYELSAEKSINTMGK